MTNKKTDQLTLAAIATTDAARDRALRRILAVMAPAARALAASRTATSDYWITEERVLGNLGGITLIWRDHGINGYGKRRPYDDERPSWSTQIVGAETASPEVLEEVARLAALYTGEIERRYREIEAATTHALALEAAAFDQILPGLPNTGDAP